MKKIDTPIDKETDWPQCIHGVPCEERCMECWPEEADDILPPDDHSGEDTNVEDSYGR